MTLRQLWEHVISLGSRAYNIFKLPHETLKFVIVEIVSSCHKADVKQALESSPFWVHIAINVYRQMREQMTIAVYGWKMIKSAVFFNSLWIQFFCSLHNWFLKLFAYLSHADNLCQQFGSRSSPIKFRA